MSPRLIVRIILQYEQILNHYAVPSETNISNAMSIICPLKKENENANLSNF